MPQEGTGENEIKQNTGEKKRSSDEIEDKNKAPPELPSVRPPTFTHSRLPMPYQDVGSCDI